MSLLDKLERHIGWIAIPSLIRIIVAFTALVCVLAYVDATFLTVLELDPARVASGEVWRLFTYLFIPRSPVQPDAMLSPLWAVLALWFLWFIGDGLERAWGAFRLTLYVLVGMIGTTIAAFVFGAQFSNTMLAASLLFAFAWFYPDEVIYVFFILPMKFKWIAWISAAFLMFGFFTQPLAYKVAMIVALSNYFLFFGPDIFHQTRHRREITERRKRFEVQTRSEAEPLHKCAVCGATELTDATREFRVSRDGEEYCIEHLPSATTAAAAQR